MSKCYAVRYSNQMVCDLCCQAWDVNDVCEPACNPPVAAHATLRDQFAIAVISGYMATESPLSSDSVEWAARHAYEVADAMLKERKK